MKSAMQRFRLALGLAGLIFAVALSAANARELTAFNGGWQFSLNQKKWKSVTLPHTWNQDDGLKPDYYRGTGWYQKKFSLLKNSRGKKIFIRFEGINQTAEVFLNDTSIGRHEGGFTAFALDLTPHLRWDKENLLMVKVSNALNPDIAPLSGDFTSFGGIYRPVHLVAVHPTHISLMDYGSMGVYVRPLKVDSNSAQIEVQTIVSGDLNPNIRVQTKILARNNVTIASRDDVAIGISRQEFKITDPKLWSGQKSPYLYRVVVHIVANGTVVDEVTESFGLRFFKVSPKDGLELNGEKLPLRGVAYHQDWHAMGWALGPKQFDQNIRLLREIGANAVRLAHYPHPQTTLDQMDKAGIVSWVEIPLVDKIGPSQKFATNIENQLIEMIRQNYNHPSILFWGLYNEIKEGPQTILKQLNVLAHREDPFRLTTAAFEGLPDKNLDPVTDLLGVNCYFGWYRGKAKDIGTYLDKLHKQHPQVPIGLSEYGAGASPFRHQQPLDQPATTSRIHPEQWQSLVHEAHLQEFKGRDYIWGTFIWNLFDFASAIRREGDQDGINDKGLISYDRKIKKDAFYFFRANWNSEPMVYLAERRFTPRTVATTAIKVFSNMQHVSVFVNGTELEPEEQPQNMTWIWNNVSLKKGRNTVRAVGQSGDQTKIDEVIWRLK